MGNITDIPPSLTTPYSAIQFLEYLEKFPITNRRKIQLISEYTKKTGVKISKDQAQYYKIDFNV